MLRRSSPSSSATLTGGDLSVDILHTEDSVRLGDGTDVLSFTTVGATKSIPVDVVQTTGATSANQTNGTQKTQIVDALSQVGEFDDVAGEKAFKVSVIASVGGGGGGTAATDSAAYTPTATQFTPIGGAFDDTASDALAEGEMGVVRMTDGRALHVAVQNSVGVTGTFWQATQPVSIAGSVAVTGTFYQATQPVSAASLPLPSGAATEATLLSIKTATELIDDGIGTIGSATPTKGMTALGSDGTNARALKTDASGELQVDVLTMPTVAVTGTFWQATQPVSGTVAVSSIAAGDNNIGNVDVVSMPTVAVTGTFWQATQPVSIASAVTTTPGGNVAHDAADSGNPLKIGGKANSSFGTAVAHGDRVDAYFDTRGRLVTHLVGPRENGLLVSTTITSSVAETTIAAAAGVGIFKELVSLQITNSSTTGTLVSLRDSTAGTVRAIYYVPAEGGIVICPSSPMHQTTANNNWTITCGTSVASIYVVAHTMNVV